MAWHVLRHSAAFNGRKRPHTRGVRRLKALITAHAARQHFQHLLSSLKRASRLLAFSLLQLLYYMFMYVNLA